MTGREDGCLALKDDIPRILIQKCLCQMLVLLTLLEFIYRFTSKNRVQPKQENFSGAATAVALTEGPTSSYSICCAG